MWKNLRIKRKRYDSDGEYHFIEQLKDMYSREKEKIRNEINSEMV